MAREIPSGSVEIQTGLWLHRESKTIGGTEYVFSKLYSSESYCFYNVNNDVYDEEGNLIDRVYVQYAALGIQYSSYTYEQLNAEFISIPIEEGMEIVGTTIEPEVA